MRGRSGALLGAALLLTIGGCASASDSAGTDAATDPSSTAPAPAGSSASAAASPSSTPVEVTVAVTDGKVAPKPHRVKVPLGSQVVLQVTSDVDDEVHVHGFDVEKPLDAGQTTTIELTADQQGVFEVETHESELLLVQLEVR